MTGEELLEAINQGENQDWEFKSAKGGVPASIYETYSAMANTSGGVIVLGVEEDKSSGKFYVDEGLKNGSKALQDIWNSINNRQRVSVNLLKNDDVSLQEVEGKTLLAIRVPKAERGLRPVSAGQNPLDSTFRRNNEGDYKCSPDEVRRMLADQSEDTTDGRILDGFGLDDLDSESLNQYRNRFASRSPDHPWLKENTQEFLRKLGGWRTDRQTGQEGLTVAGLLMFGKDDSITDTNAVPNFHVDYREVLTDDPSVRWTDRLTADGTWNTNLFQFYERTIPKLTSDLKVPFRLEGLTRQDDTPVHEALREALANALIHADYRGQGGIVIIRRRQGVELANPGSLLVSISQLRRGGVSECRNKSIQKMFQMIGRGEKAGSGFDTILQGWQSQKWQLPDIEETVQPDRVTLKLPMTSLIPEDSLAQLHEQFGDRMNGLSAEEVQALVIAEVEDEVSNSRLQLLSDSHPADISRLLTKLAGLGLLEAVGQKRGTFYILPQIDNIISSNSNVGSQSSNIGTSSHISNPGSHVTTQVLSELSKEETKRLRSVAYPDGYVRRAPVEQMRKAILRVCAERFLTAPQLGWILLRNPDALRNQHLTQMVRDGLLRTLYTRPNHPEQAYRTTKQGDGEG